MLACDTRIALNGGIASRGSSSRPQKSVRVPIPGGSFSGPFLVEARPVPKTSLFSKAGRTLPFRGLRAALGAILAGLCAIPLPLTTAYGRLPDREEEEARAQGQADAADERPGETLDEGSAFPLVSIPEKANQSKDPAIAALAARILDGSADLRY